jgi:hypothetical protein
MGRGPGKTMRAVEATLSERWQTFGQLATVVFDVDHPTRAQVESTRNAIQRLARRYDGIEVWRTHEGTSARVTPERAAQIRERSDRFQKQLLALDHDFERQMQKVLARHDGEASRAEGAVDYHRHELALAEAHLTRLQRVAALQRAAIRKRHLQRRREFLKVNPDAQEAKP